MTTLVETNREQLATATDRLLFVGRWSSARPSVRPRVLHDDRWRTFLITALAIALVSVSASILVLARTVETW